MKKVVIVGATGTAGKAGVNAFIEHGGYQVKVIVRKGVVEKTSSGFITPVEEKKKIYDEWKTKGVEFAEADLLNHQELISAFRGYNYLVSFVSFPGTEIQFSLVFAAKEAGIERFIPSEFGFVYEQVAEMETDTTFRTYARQKRFLKRIIELAGLDYTIICCGLWPEYFMLEPVMVMGDGNQKFSFSWGVDCGRIVPHILAHPASRNAIIPVAATAYMTWNELLEQREKLRGSKVERIYLNLDQFKDAYNKAAAGSLPQHACAIGVAALEAPEGRPPWGNWAEKNLPDYKPSPLTDFFPMCEALCDLMKKSFQEQSFHKE